MKFHIFFILIASLIITSTGNAAEIYNNNGKILDCYGKLSGVHYLSKNYNKKGDHSFIYYGCSAQTLINEKITGFGTWEHEAPLNQDKTMNPSYRRGFVGLKFADYGSVDYGRNYGILYDVGAFTDVMPEFGGGISIVDNYLSNRAIGVLTYRNTNFFGMIEGLDFALQFQGKNDNSKQERNSLKQANGEGYGLSVSYHLSPELTTAAAYANSKRTMAQKILEYSNSSNNAEAYSFGLKYDIQHLYLAALYTNNRNMVPFGDFNKPISDTNAYGFAKKTKNIELVAQYQFDFGFRPSIGYLQSRIRENNNNLHHDIIKYIELGGNYNFNKNISTFLDYRINLMNKNDAPHGVHLSTDNILAIGISYIF